MEDIKPEYADSSQSKMTAAELIDSIEARQKQTSKDLSKYGVVTTIISLVILSVGLTVQYLNNSLSNDQLQLFKSILSPSIGGIMAFVFTIVAYIVNVLFGVWAISFVPYIGIRAFKISQTVSMPLRLARDKWIQLILATLLPIIIFSVLISSLPQSEHSLIVTLTFKDAILILVGTIVVWLVLFAVTRFVPLKYIIIHLSIFSVLLYTTVFLAYILGFGIFTYCVLFGVMFFLLSSTNTLPEITRRISIFDVEDNVAGKIIEILNSENAIKIQQASIELGEFETIIGEREQKLQISQQLLNIRKTKVAFNNKVNETKLGIFNQKLVLLNQLYSILSSEYSLKTNQDLPNLVSKFKIDVKGMTSEQMIDSMNDIITKVNTSLNTIPQGLDHIKIELKKATLELREATEELANDSN